jgi:hypothetical protein
VIILWSTGSGHIQDSRGIAVPTPYAFLPRLIISAPCQSVPPSNPKPAHPQAAPGEIHSHSRTNFPVVLQYITPIASQPPYSRVLSITNPKSFDPKRCQFANRLLIHHEPDSLLLILEYSEGHIYRLRNPNRLPSSRNSRDQFLTCTDQRQRFPLPLVPTTYHGDGLVTLLSASK